MDRRQFLALGGASTVVGLAGCSDVFDGGDTQPDDGAQTDTDDAAGWRSVGRTPRVPSDGGDASEQFVERDPTTTVGLAAITSRRRRRSHFYRSNFRRG